jgi:phage-related minor tail protein
MAVEKLTFEMNAVGNAVPEMKKVQTQLGNVSKSMAVATSSMRTHAAAGRMVARSQGNLTRNLGMASLQFQDIAVQASMGTNALRIMTMQGPQLASVFGPKGMIIGALVAVGGALAMMRQSTTKLTFDFKKFGADMKTAFAPFIDFIRPAVDLVKRGFDLLKTGAMAAINGVVNGINYFAVIISNVPAIVREAFNKMGARIEHFKLNFEFMTLTVKKVFFQMLQGVVERFSKAMNFLSTELNKFGANFPEDIGKGALDGLNDSLDDISHRLKSIPMDMFLNRLDFEEPNQAIQNMRTELDNIQKIDLFSYFSRVSKSAEDAADKMKSITTVADMIGNKFETAFMSAVKGTASMKDAFRQMAIDIIAELYRIFVVKQITGFITRSISAAFPTFAGIPARANGGPVNANTPYMVGERGPELFVPARSGSITPNNQLRGNGGQVTVNQTINVTTGVQQTVRNEIQTLLPQIAEVSKAAVLDARRRGGSFANAF